MNVCTVIVIVITVQSMNIVCDNVIQLMSYTPAAPTPAA